MQTEQLDKEKACAIMNFVDLMIGAFESGHTTTNTLTLAQLHRIAEIQCIDEYGVYFGSIENRHGEDVAKLCGLNLEANEIELPDKWQALGHNGEYYDVIDVADIVAALEKQGFKVKV